MQDTAEPAPFALHLANTAEKPNNSKIVPHSGCEIRKATHVSGNTDPFVNARSRRALAHPTRSAVLELLIGEKGLAPSALGARLGVTAANASYHVDVLLDCGALEAVPGGAGGSG